MTLERQAKGFDQATMTIHELISWEEMGVITDRTPRSVQYWGQPNSTTAPTLLQAAALDSAYRAAGGKIAPYTEALAYAVDVQISNEDACYRALAAETALFVREAGELGAALIEASQPGASPRAHNRALVEAEQVETALSALMRRLPRFFQFGAGSHLGKTGGTQ